MDKVNLSLESDKYTNHVQDTFNQMFKENDLTDITLICDDRKQLKSHKIVLSSWSPVFKSIISSLPSFGATVYLRGVKSADMETLLEFMYLGQATSYQDKIKDVLAVANSLEIKGITKFGEVTTKDNKVDSNDSDVLIEKEKMIKENLKVRSIDSLVSTEYLLEEETFTNINSASLIRNSLMDVGAKGGERQRLKDRDSKPNFVEPETEGIIKLVEDTTEYFKDNTKDRSEMNETENTRKELENPKDGITKKRSEKQAAFNNMSSANMLIKSLMDVGSRGGARQQSRRSSITVPTPEATTKKDALTDEDVDRLEEELVKFPNPSVYYKKKIAARLTKEINVSERLIINWLNENGKRDL